MRILILGDLPPFVLGGAERQLLLLAQAWRSAGHDVLVFGHRTPTGMHEGVPARRIRVIYRGGRLVRAASFAASLAWQLVRERGRIDAVYCRFLGEAALVTATMKMLRLVRAPLVVAPAAAGCGVHSDLARLRASMFWHALRRCLRSQVQTFNAISPALRDELAATGLEPISMIPNGAELPPWAPRNMAGTGRRSWLFCGRLVHQKGVDLLLEAMARARVHGVEFPLQIAGEGPEAETLAALAQRLGLAGRVTFLGRLTHRALQDKMRQAHALVLPSRYEGLSNAALEALCVGLPIISTRCGGIDVYLEPDVGWTCEAHPDSLAAALRAAASESGDQWAARSQRSRALAEARFSIHASAEAHLALFRRLLAPRRPDTPRDTPRPSAPR